MSPWAKGLYLAPKNTEQKDLSYLHFIENKPSQPRQHYIGQCLWCNKPNIIVFIVQFQTLKTNLCHSLNAEMLLLPQLLPDFHKNYIKHIFFGCVFQATWALFSNSQIFRKCLYESRNPIPHAPLLHALLGRYSSWLGQETALILWIAGTLKL